MPTVDKIDGVGRQHIARVNPVEEALANDIADGLFVEVAFAYNNLPRPGVVLGTSAVIAHDTQGNLVAFAHGLVAGHHHCQPATRQLAWLDGQPVRLDGVQHRQHFT
ncbi:hypothetical protein D3C81_1846480 [compost metagenome]